MNLREALQSHIETFQNIDIDAIEKVIGVTIQVYRHDGILYAFGNGGSAADANHFVGELVPYGFRAVSLPANPSAVTAIGNDFGYDDVFSRQILTMTRKGDILYAFSTSGTSPNVIKAIESVKDRGVVTVGFTSKRGQKLVDTVDYAIVAPTDNTQRAQEYHEFVYHQIWLALIEEFRK